MTMVVKGEFCKRFTSLSPFPADRLSRLIRLRGLLRIKINYISELQK
jgi:hypothetical protein